MKRIAALIAIVITTLILAAPAAAGFSDGGDAPRVGPNTSPGCVYIWLPGSTQKAICR